MDNIIDLYARAAATVYGVINFDDFFRIMDSYYGKGGLSKEKIMQYFWTSDNDDPIYYVQDDLIVHASISPDEVTQALYRIHHPIGAAAPPQHRILPEKEFLQYANPLYYEDSRGTQKMAAFLTDDLGIAPEDAKDIVLEMVFICRTGSCPTLLMDAIKRRGYPVGLNHNLQIIERGIEIAANTRQWERLGATGNEMAGRQ